MRTFIVSLAFICLANVSNAQIQNGSFETPAIASYAYRPSAVGWTFVSNAGIQHNNSAWGAPNATDGVQTAFLQDGTTGGNGTISQVFSVPSDGPFSVSFSSALRSYRTSSTIMSFKVTMDGATIGTFSPTSMSFSQFTTNTVQLTAGSHTLSFVGTGASPDTSDFIDFVTLNSAPAQAAPTNISPPTIAGTPQVGQILTGTHGSWTNAPTSYSDQWFSNSVAIAGATAMTYSPQPTDVGFPITLREVATNSIGSSSEAISAATAPVTASASGIVNGSFETPTIASYTYRPNTGGNWTFTGGSGIQHNGSAWGAPSAPGGVQTAFLQLGTGDPNGIMSQSFNVPAGTYSISFYSALRSYRTGPNIMSFNVTLDGNNVGSFSPTSTSFSQFTTSQVSLTAGSHTLSFVGTGTTPDTSDFIDLVALGGSGGGGGTFTLTKSVVGTGISGATSMAFAPDGRIFVNEQAGKLRVIKNNALLPTPFVDMTATTDAQGERGFIGVTVDPNFNSNHFVYVYHTVAGSPTHNRVSRFVANGDVAVPGSEVIILDLDNLSANNHNGGAINFGTDGKLYVNVGDNANGSNAQSITNRLGKILRINADGTIPADNPTSFPGITGATSGLTRSIWAVGFRNPYTSGVNLSNGKIFVNDVGEAMREEIDDLQSGKNYGWPNQEGFLGTSSPNYTPPLIDYPHDGSPTACSIVGGAFYLPATNTFGDSFLGKYFYADLCGGWIRMLDPATNSSTTFDTGYSQPVDLRVGADGALYLLTRGSGGQVWRLQRQP